MVHSKEKIDLQKHPEQIQPSDLLDKDFKTTILNTLRGKYKELTEIRKMIQKQNKIINKKITTQEL